MPINQSSPSVAGDFEKMSDSSGPLFTVYQDRKRMFTLLPGELVNLLKTDCWHTGMTIRVTGPEREEEK